MTEKHATNDAGIPVEGDERSLTVGTDGPIVLQDHYLIERCALPIATVRTTITSINHAPIREGMDDAQREHLVNNVLGHSRKERSKSARTSTSF
ncbi:hypothetical protein [Litorivivens sp.]|uniref:hypothetical protein n=1 Tax=Litorivivens sp. TaxID=2020868 RepID=UPI003563E7AA